MTTWSTLGRASRALDARINHREERRTKLSVETASFNTTIAPSPAGEALAGLLPLGAR